MSLISRRRFLQGLVAAPAVILTPGLLMKIKPVLPSMEEWMVAYSERVANMLINPPILIKAVYADSNGRTLLAQQAFEPFLLQPGDQVFFDMKLPSAARIIDLAMEYKTGEPYEMQALERAGQRLSLSSLHKDAKLSVRLEQAGVQEGEQPRAITRANSERKA